MRINSILLCFLASLFFLSNPISAQDTTTLDSTGAPEKITHQVKAGDSVVEEEIIALTPKDEFKNNKAFKIAAIIAFIVFLGWLGLIILYYAWAIHKYVHNYGLSNHEWKVLYPEIYAAPKMVDKYIEIRNASIEKRQQSVLQETGDEEQAKQISSPLEEPAENPYAKDSFGLPPGTIRGTLALTALVMFLLIEGVNLFSRMNLETHFDGLITAFKMVLAFYFGSRAVDALKTTETRRQEVEKEEAKKETPAVKKVTTTTPVVVQEELPNEKPAMPSRYSASRAENLAIPEAAKTDSETKEMKNAALAQRVVSLTASFETGRTFPDSFAVIAGNFDGQGISFGALQWNIGQGSLQKILQKMQRQHNDVLQNISGRYYDELIDMLNQPLKEQLAWAKGIQMTTTNSRNRTIWRVTKDWKTLFDNLGRTQEMIDIQVEAALDRFNIALANCDYFKLTSERSAALMFDINVQNGRVGVKNVKQNIWDDYSKLSPNLSPENLEIERMKIIAQRRAEASHAQWRQDVLSRKMTIAAGHGTVHGKDYNLEKEYNITLKSIA